MMKAVKAEICVEQECVKRKNIFLIGNVLCFINIHTDYLLIL